MAVTACFGLEELSRKGCLRTGVYLCSAVVAPSTAKNVYEGNTGRTNESGWDRVQKIFTIDEYGDYSPEASFIYQTTLFVAFGGACYGGFMQSRNAYLEFIERNEATKFKHHFDAKRALQNHVTVNFAKGAFKWSWRIALFAGLYVTCATCASTYRGEPSIFDYVLGGLVSGVITRVNYGLRGVIVGGIVGSFIGLSAGAMTLTALRFTGTNLDDIYQWQGEQYQARQRHIQQATEKSQYDEHHIEMLKDHDRKVSQ